ncbi:rubisco accumulation factor 1.1, chloroplastic [Ricinus communis]|uniref:rubisco accumulation factor 1.1, chloroplastic n=1 Tax=Ricinus communis TaxID=3988 RepID=UPI00201B2B31|nr:rubisco accumulation factor 1.1, chloroplastic [Ricinus communis]
MLSATVNTHIPISLSNPNKPFSSSFITPLFTYVSPSSQKTQLKPISAALIPSTPPPSNQQLYQPFRPPPSPIPSQFSSLDTAGRLEVLANRLGLWYEYAPLIPSLIQEGFSPPSIEESTGISGVEQNRLVVAAKVRESLTQSQTAAEIVSEFDTGGAELLYEIRLLSAPQRAAAARFIVENRLDAKGAEDLARAMKDFPRRRGDKGWESFDYTLPGDCLSFMYYRQSREHKTPSEPRTNALERALDVAESEKAKNEVLKELEGDSEGKEEKEGEVGDATRVPVVRLRIGEVAEATSVVVLPVCRALQKEKEILEAPWECKSEGEFGVVVAEKGWERWVVLPGWEPVVGLEKGGVVVAFPDARALPWKVNRWYKEEAILVVADRGSKEVNANDGFYLVAVDGSGDGRSGGLEVERGSILKERGVEESLGTVVLVVRPPKEQTDQLSDENWE